MVVVVEGVCGVNVFFVCVWICVEVDDVLFIECEVEVSVNVLWIELLLDFGLFVYKVVRVLFVVMLF